MSISTKRKASYSAVCSSLALGLLTGLFRLMGHSRQLSAEFLLPAVVILRVTVLISVRAQIDTERRRRRPMPARGQRQRRGPSRCALSDNDEVLPSALTQELHQQTGASGAIDLSNSTERARKPRHRASSRTAITTVEHFCPSHSACAAPPPHRAPSLRDVRRSAEAAGKERCPAVPCCRVHQWAVVIDGTPCLL